ncbi:hypothetical protein BsWGS_27990 [Bradybaena similaris]
MAVVLKTYLTASMFLFWVVNKGKADNFGDIRCACICDKTWNQDGKKVVIRSPIAKELCNCQNVVTPLFPSLACPGCVCNVQTRDTRTIKKAADEDPTTPASTSAEATSSTAKESPKLNTTQRKQKKCEGSVKEQRKNIYKHSMLN